MKYKKELTVDAIYTNNSLKNPYIEAMPELISKDEYKKEILSLPPHPHLINSKSPEERREELSMLNKFFYPMDYMYCIYDMLYRAIISNYNSKTILESIKQMNIIYQKRNGVELNANYSTQSFSGAILGISGIGKSSTIKRSLSLIPQVIIHKNYNNTYLYQKQITHLIVECPCDCSVKTLAANIISSVDQAIGSNYFEEMVKNKRLSSSSALAMKVKIICLNHRVGVLVIDEIQNAILTAERTKQVKPLIKFLVELTNETCVSICFSGTLDAEDLFCSQEHLMRRTRGYRLLPLKPNITYYNFISAIWDYQWLINKTELKENLMNMIYDYSGGVPDYILKIFVNSQIQAIFDGIEKITPEIIKKTVMMLNIQVRRTYTGGNSISDFELSEISFSDDSFIKEQNKTLEKESYYRMKRRGRPFTKRDDNDIIQIFKETENQNEFITKLLDKKYIQIIERSQE